MNRPIKFRAWNEKKSDMIYLEDLTTANWDIKFIFKHYKIMQYTGLTDKKGVEIYEGDILQLKNTKGQVSNHQEVYWNDEAACWGWRTAKEDSWPDSFSGFYNDYEVIGNIYENPELLK